MTATNESGSAAALADDAIESYHRDGYAIYRNVFAPDEITQLNQEAASLLERDELIDTQNIRCRWQDYDESGECMFD